MTTTTEFTHYFLIGSVIEVYYDNVFHFRHELEIWPDIIYRMDYQKLSKISLENASYLLLRGNFRTLTCRNQDAKSSTFG